MSKGYIPVIGLEIHAELATNSKVFCDCSAEGGYSETEGQHNTRCCPVCTGMPGTLPVINQTAVEYAVKAGYALGCNINKFSVFDRKNYFYPDLPKAYQISQLYFPLCVDGKVTIEVDGKKKDIRINRIHLEEDAGKLVHDDWNDVTLADYNRCGVPLIEIVTEPDLSSAAETKAFIEKVQLLLQYSGVSDCKMERGHMRADVNVSIMRDGDAEYGTRTECKNLNSVKSITRSIDYEIKRQAQVLDSGKRVVQETRRFNENRGETSSMRSKEDAHDYRYFPEPDILQVNFTDETLGEIKAKLPESPYERADRYVRELKIKEKDAEVIISKKAISDFFEECLLWHNSPGTVANFLIGELLRRVNLGEIDIDNFNVLGNDLTSPTRGFLSERGWIITARAFAKLIELADNGMVSKNDAKFIFRMMVETGQTPESIAEKNGFLIKTDFEKVDNIIAKIISENPTVAAQYANGDKKVFGFLMGLCNKELKGAATPKIIKESLENALGNAANTATSAKSEVPAQATVNPSAKAENAYSSGAYLNPPKTIGGATLEKEFSLCDLKVGEPMSFKACVHKIRKMSNVTFIVLRTGRYLVQTVYTENECKSDISNVREGAFVAVSGIPKKEGKAPLGVEVILSDISLISAPAFEYPLRVSDKVINCSLDINLDNRTVALRNPHQRAVFKISEGVCGGFREFLIKEGFTEIHSPKIVAQGAEGGANIFHIQYFDKPAFLNQSPQFYKQTAIAFFDRVFEIAPVYRAEKHATSRHINEYIGLDFEMGYIDSMYDVMAMETACLTYTFNYLREHYSYELELLCADIPVITEIPTVTLAEGKAILGDKGSGNKADLEPEDEVALCEYAKEKYGSEFIFVTHFPSAKPPFYAMDSREDPRFAYKFDLLFRGLEITSGGQRIHDYDEQLAKIRRQGLNPEDFKSYLEAHKYGLPPHGGLGIGLERLVMKMLNLPNIRQASLFPRDINRLLP